MTGQDLSIRENEDGVCKVYVRGEFVGVREDVDSAIRLYEDIILRKECAQCRMRAER